MQDEGLSCRRRSDGSIDYDYYRKETARLRAQALSAAMRSAFHKTRGLLGAAVTLVVPLVQGRLPLGPARGRDAPALAVDWAQDAGDVKKSRNAR